MKKHSKKIVSLMLALLMVFSLLPMSSISALAAGSGNSSVAWQADDETATAAPAPVFYSDWTDLSNASATYYAGDSDKVGELRIAIKYNTSAYNQSTLTVLWQVSDDGTNFTDIEGAGGAISSSMDSTYVPDITLGQTKYYRAIVTNKGLEEGMTPSSITSAVAKIVYTEGQRPRLEIDKAMLRQADGTLVSDDALNEITLWGGNGDLPKKYTNVATYTGNVLRLRDSAWDTDTYVFRGWQIGDKLFDGRASKEAAVKAGPNETSALKGFITVADSDWYYSLYQSPFEGRNTYYIDYEGTTTQDDPLKVCHITPVFEKLPEMAYQISLVQTNGGTISQVRDDAETHTLTATPTSSLYKFVRWEQSVDGGQTWTAMDGDARVQVTLDKDTTYRAIFESPYKISNMEINGYALQSTGDSWYLNVSATLSEELPTTSMSVTLRVYDGETADADNLLGEYNTSFRMLYADQEVTAKATKRPSSNTGKVLVVLQTETGETAQTVYQLKGTLDATPASVDVDTFTTAFLGREPAEVQLSASGDPAVKSVFWSGGNATLGTANNSSTINESTGLVTFNAYTMNRTVSFYANAGDGRIAEAKVNFKSCGQASKINEKAVKVPEGESKEYQAVNTNATLSVSRQKVSVKSSDESIFTAEIITRAGSGWQPKDIVDKYKITGVKAGTATLTITVNGKSAEWPVVIQSAKEEVKEVTLSDKEVNLYQGDSKTLEASVTPETSLTTLSWSSSAPNIVSVEDGKITGLKAGHAVITVTATDALGNSVKASSNVTVTDHPYTVEVYAPKGMLAADGLKFAPSAGLDETGHDIFDTEHAITDVSVDTEYNNQYDVYTMTLQAGTYSYRAVSADGKNLGGGAFTFPDSQTSTVDGRTARVFLRQTEVSLTNEFDGQKAEAKDFAVQLTNDVSTATMGDSYVNADGYTVYPTLLSANDSLSYYLAAIPSDAYVKAHNVMASRTQGVAVAKDTSVLSLTAELKTGALTINAPADADVAICEQMSDGQIAEYKADNTAAQEDGTVDYIFHVAMTGKMFYRVSGASYVTYNGTTVDGTDARIVVSADMLNPSGSTKTTLDRNTASNGGANLADLYLNVNAQGYLKLDEEGSTFKLNAKRNWWGSNVTWVMDKDYRLIEPDFHYQVVGLDGKASSDVITVDNDGTVKAVGDGTAIVLVTYDSMTLKYHDEVKYSYDNYDPNGFYGAIWPENTGVFVVSVGSGNSGITTGMTLNKDLNQGKSSKQAGDALDAELDPIYFTGETGTYTFTPGTEGVSVSVANPTIGDNALSFSGFKALTAEKDGSYNVPLTNGRNIVKLEKDGKAEYQVITAKQVSVKVNGQDLENAVVAPGEKVSVTFDTLFNPVTRMKLYNTDAAAIYTKISGLDGKKAGSARGSYGYYFFGSTAAKQTVENFVEEGTDSSGYDNPIVTVKDALTVPEDYSAENFVLSGGTFNVAGFGGDYGAHRDMIKTWENLSPNTKAYMGQLPDISIPVGTLESIEVTAQPTKTSYYVGEKFDASGMKVTAIYKGSEGTFTKEISNYTFDEEAFAKSGKQNVTISYTLGDVTKTAEVSVDVKDVVLEKLEVVTPPAKTTYRVGEKFDTTGMVVTASYNDGSVREITDYKVTPDTIAADTDHVLVTYGGKAASVAVTVNKVASIAVTKAPAKTEYEEGDLFNPTGMVVTLTYQDGSTEETTAYSYAPKSRLTKDITEVTVTYTGKDAVADIADAKLAISVKDKTAETADHITAYVSYSDQGAFVTGSEGTLLWNAPVTVYDRDGDGQYTMSDVFRALHEEYYYAGADGYADTDGGWVTRFWGVNTGMVSYALNHAWVYGTQTAVNDGDQLGLFVYADTMNYSDLYTWFDEITYRTDVNKENSFTVNGLSLMNSGPDSPVTAAPANATVTVYDEDGNVVEGLGTKTDEKGQFKVIFPKDGKYTIEVNGTCTYTCSGYGGSGMNTYKDATVVPTRCTVLVGTARGTLGDVNNDGVIDLTDAAQLLDKVTAGEKVDTYIGDINGDGTVDLMDVADLMDRITAE